MCQWLGLRLPMWIQSCHTCGTSLPALFNNGSYTVSDGTFGLILPESLSSGDPLFLCVAHHNHASCLTLFESEWLRTRSLSSSSRKARLRQSTLQLDSLGISQSH